ncbi:uncharacterized protein LOC135940948 [Cloeon dipterum]|uniref:uncharacterized protein LOC135940948 n=1 Tax=Cloeon dipterum TaxID=197152 RepID=UPI00321FA8DA
MMENSLLRSIFIFLLCVVLATIFFFNIGYKNETDASTERIVTEQVFHPQDYLGVDKINISNDEIAKKLFDSHPNLVPSRLTEYGPRQNDSCALYVNMLDANHNNIYWQEQRAANDTYYLFGAYLDNRTTLNADPAVRIIAMLDKRNRTQNLTCQFWYQKERMPIVSAVSEYRQLWANASNSSDSDLHPFLLSCVVPKLNNSVVPESVSLVGAPCQNATNNLRVVYNGAPNGTKKGFAVCVTALGLSLRSYLPVLPIRLVEWIELIKILGAEKIVFHEMKTHPNLSSVLEHYSNAGEVEVSGLSLPGYLTNVPDFILSYLNTKPHIRTFIEDLAYNDCYYKYVHQFEFLVVLDIFEVIIPKLAPDWRALLSEPVKKSPASSFTANRSVFVDDKAELHDWSAEVPKYLHMLQHVYRNFETNVTADMPIENAVFHKSTSPFFCVRQGSNCRSDFVDAQLHKYCVGREEDECKTERGAQLQIDTTIRRFKGELIKASNKALKTLGLVKFT